MKRALAITLSIIIVVSAFSVVATASAMPFMNYRNMPRLRGILGNSQVQSSYVYMNGVVNQWGTTAVNGALQAQSRTIVVNNTDTKQATSATAIWTTNSSRAISAVRSKENFTYTFYAARLVTPDTSALNINSADFYVNGTWTVYQVTSSLNVTTDANGTITGVHRSTDSTPLATQAYGELEITGSRTTFSLSITGVDTLTGSVHAQRITNRMFNPFKVNDNGNTVTSADIASVAMSYGSMPGWGNYDQRMDYNFNYKIDICDLATATANLNS